MFHVEHRGEAQESVGLSVLPRPLLRGKLSLPKAKEGHSCTIDCLRKSQAHAANPSVTVMPSRPQRLFHVEHRG